MEYDGGKHCLRSQLTEAYEKARQIRAALEMTQFGFNHARCPVCTGWNMSPNGETDRVHTKNCPVAEALALKV